MMPSTTSGVSESTFEIPQGRPGQRLLRELRQQFELREGPRLSREAVYLDTHDGRLYAQSRALWSSDGVLQLESLDRPDPRTRIELDGVPAFADRLPPGGLRDELVPLTRNRALLDLFSVRSQERTWSRWNRDQKTVLRVSASQDEASDGMRTARLGSFVVVRQVRGYKKIFREVCEWWEERGIHAGNGSRYRKAVKALGLDPLRTASVSKAKLDASMTAAEAVRAMIRAQYQVARANEEGVLNDTDAEFLHDFRVAVRRARSYLRQLRDVFAAEPGARLRKNLSWLGKSTNVLRDLDVYLEQQADYRNLLAAPLTEDITPLFEFAARERETAYRTLAGVMGSGDYDAAMRRWRSSVEDDSGLGTGRRGAEPVLTLAGARVARTCRAVLEQGARLRNQKDAAAFHSLRIECKQLRYLMEILGDLMPEAKGAVQRLKKLQDALGTIQDLTVHEARTQDFAQAMSAAGDGRALPAAEVLVSRMRVKRELECGRVPELFAQFSRSLRETEPPYVVLLPWLRRIHDD